MSSSSYYSHPPEIPSHCGCEFPDAHKQSWTPRNPGRRFVGCKFYNPSTGMKGCELFLWVDRSQEEWQRAVINNLMLEKQLVEKQVEHLKSQFQGFEDENSKLKEENEKLKLIIKRLFIEASNRGQVNYLLVVVIAILVVVVVKYVA